MNWQRVRRMLAHEYEPDEWWALGVYNSERARGLVHTPEWDAKMAEEQARYEQQQARTWRDRQV